MAIQEPIYRPSKHLTDIIDIRSDREAIWLYCENWQDELLPPDSLNGGAMRPLLDAFLEGLDIRDLRRAKKDKDSALLPDQQLDWIQDNKRQLNYLERQMSSELPRLRHPRLHGRTLLIARLDIWPASLEAKTGLLSKVKRDWESQKNISEKYCGWLKVDKERVQYAIRWLDENGRKIGIYRPMPQDSSDLEDILTYFDRVQLRLLEAKEITNSIRVSWNREQHRKRNTDKKQMNVILPHAAIEALDLLAKKSGRTRAEVIERLVTAETKEALYLD